MIKLRKGDKLKFSVLKYIFLFEPNMPKKNKCLMYGLSYSAEWKKYLIDDYNIRIH